MKDCSGCQAIINAVRFSTQPVPGVTKCDKCGKEIVFAVNTYQEEK